MSVIYLLILFGLIVALLFLGAFFWAVKNGQFDDMYTPSVRMLFDDDNSIKKEIDENEEKNDNKLSNKMEN